jgi:hypothetical protein
MKKWIVFEPLFYYLFFVRTQLLYKELIGVQTYQWFVAKIIA